MCISAGLCREAGCGESVALPGKHEHESQCAYRRVRCQHDHHGCQEVLTVKDMFWHNKMCSYAHHPHKNVLPKMPGDKQKQSARTH